MGHVVVLVNWLVVAVSEHCKSVIGLCSGEARFSQFGIGCGGAFRAVHLRDCIEMVLLECTCATSTVSATT